MAKQNEVSEKTFAGIVMEYDLQNGVKSFLKERFEVN